METPRAIAPIGIDRRSGTSPHGAWAYGAWRPPHLGGLIDHVWAYEGPTTHRRKRVFPNGCTELILNFGEPYRIVEGAGTEICRHAWVGGPQAGPMVLEQPAYQHVVGVRLRASGAYAVVARPMREVAGLSVDLADLVGKEASELVERCAASASFAGRFALVGEWIVRRFLSASRIDPAVAWAMAQLEASDGNAPIAMLRERTGLSKTRIVASFRDQVGLAPKLYGRVLRFHRALALLQKAEAARLPEVALDAHFYDQPHMNAEFRALGGITPGEFLAARHPVGDGSTVSDGPPAS